MSKQVVGTHDHLNFPLTLRRYQAYGEDAANYFDGKVFRKAFKNENKLFLLSLRESNDGVALQVQPSTRSQTVLQHAERLTRKILGLDFSLEKFYQFAKDDSILCELTQKFHGLRPTLKADPFESLITSISAQQINLQFAFTVRSRLVRR
jgi:DNA-3-methyladenine glycosylase II